MMWLGVLKIICMIASLSLVMTTNAYAREFTQIGDSMEPTIRNGETVEASVFRSFIYEPKRFDVVLYERKGAVKKFFIGRIIGLPSESVEINERGVFVDGNLLQFPERMIRHGIRYVSVAEMNNVEYEKTVYELDKDEYFILGDNSLNSNDSRFIGPILRNLIAVDITGK